MQGVHIAILRARDPTCCVVLCCDMMRRTEWVNIYVNSTVVHD
jgi:hypothetical protein